MSIQYDLLEKKMKECFFSWRESEQNVYWDAVIEAELKLALASSKIKQDKY